LNWGGGSLFSDKINSKSTNTSLETKAYEVVGMEVLFNLKALDSIMRFHKMNIGMIKIDVEGHELQAFKGMKSLLKKINQLFFLSRIEEFFIKLLRKLNF
jgi:FkbM family methyltransferase